MCRRDVGKPRSGKSQLSEVRGRNVLAVFKTIERLGGDSERYEKAARSTGSKGPMQLPARVHKHRGAMLWAGCYCSRAREIDDCCKGKRICAFLLFLLLFGCFLKLLFLFFVFFFNLLSICTCLLLFLVFYFQDSQS